MKFYRRRAALDKWAGVIDAKMRLDIMNSEELFLQVEASTHPLYSLCDKEHVHAVVQSACTEPYDIESS